MRCANPHPHVEGCGGQDKNKGTSPLQITISRGGDGWSCLAYPLPFRLVLVSVFWIEDPLVSLHQENMVITQESNFGSLQL